MGARKGTSRNLNAGDLVTHALYGKEWIGMIVKVLKEEDQVGLSRQQVLVQMQPGTAFDGFFERRGNNKVHRNLGYVSIHWLFKIEVEDVNSGPSRDKT